MKTTITKTVLTFVVFLLCSKSLLWITQPSAITSNFEELAPYFHVLGKINGEYEILYLSDVFSETGKYQFYLDEEVELVPKEIYSVKILENSSIKQRVKFFYSDTYISESIYEVSGNAITPVEYKLISSMGHFGIYFMIIAISLTLAIQIANLIIRQWYKGAGNK